MPHRDRLVAAVARREVVADRGQYLPPPSHRWIPPRVRKTQNADRGSDGKRSFTLLDIAEMKLRVRLRSDVVGGQEVRV